MERAKVEAMLEKLEKRAAITREHANQTQHILNTWARAGDDRDTYVKIYYLINGTLDYLKKFKSNFPNYEQHVDQWTTLQNVAKSRTNI